MTAKTCFGTGIRMFFLIPSLFGVVLKIWQQFEWNAIEMSANV